ncbi:MAG: glycosyltransferase family 4 protein [Bacteroidetes bacterium]|nr:glycosyltransferase family 4 protein [Bacteroidota bacterium]
MRVVYIHQYYLTPDDWGSTRSYYFSRALADAGHEVFIITSCKTQKKEVTYNGKITIYYLPIAYSQNFSKRQRIWSYLKFSVRAFLLVLGLKNISLIYATSTPLSVGIISLAIKKVKDIKYIFEVRDLWPEVPIALGFIKNKWMISILKSVTKSIYKNAEKIVAASTGMEEGIKLYKTETPITVITNFSDTEIFKPQLTPKSPKGDLMLDFELRRKYLKDEEKGIIYFGAIGMANHLEYFLEAAKASQEAKLSLKFFVVGDGSEKERLQKIAIKSEINNLIFLPPIPKKNLPELLSVMDFSYISFLHIPELFTSSPNKLFDSLAMGLACITNTIGWMQEVLETSESGLFCNPNQPSDFVEKIKPFLTDENLLSTFKANARRVAEEKFSTEVCCERLLSLFETEINFKKN